MSDFKPSSGLEINVTPQLSVTKREHELMTVVEEEAMATHGANSHKLIVQPHSKRS